jgi:hypothetical protein
MEGRKIQQRVLCNSRRVDRDHQIANSYSKLMRQGKVKVALKLLSKHEVILLDVIAKLQ